MRILIVCTANICRSPSAEWLLRDSIGETPALAGTEVRSAGTHAIEGSPGCRIAPALVGRAEQHRSAPLTPALVVWADLILTAAREHRAVVVSQAPQARSRAFTLRQAGRIATWLDAEAAAQGPRSESIASPPVLPDPWSHAGHALLGAVEDMDAARGVAPMYESRGAADAVRPRGIWRARRPARPEDVAGVHDSDIHPDDIADPHVLGAGLHARAAAEIDESVQSVVRYLSRVAGRAGAGAS